MYKGKQITQIFHLKSMEVWGLSPLKKKNQVINDPHNDTKVSDGAANGDYEFLVPISNISLLDHATFSLKFDHKLFKIFFLHF